jgi:short subunit dehydrogenase-like uncharacterized protein
MGASVLVYGATGFTARLVMENLLLRGIDFIAAGRDRAGVEAAARQLAVSTRVFRLDDAGSLARQLSGITLVLNAAGPFRETTAPLVRACLQAGAHYLDVSGEVLPLALLARLDAAARARGIMLLPSVGFDVVPSDCLAVHLARRLPGAEELTVSIQGLDLLSRGSARTFADHAGIPTFVRRSGELEPVRYRIKTRWTDFGDGYRPTVRTSWGDLVTAYRSTGIPNIEVYFEATTPRLLGIAGNQMLGDLLGAPAARAWLRRMADVVPPGPPHTERVRHGARLLGEVRRGMRRARALMLTGEAYDFTGEAAATVVGRVLAGGAIPGFQTPATCFGPDLALSMGARLEDIP